MGRTGGTVTVVEYAGVDSLFISLDTEQMFWDIKTDAAYRPTGRTYGLYTPIYGGGGRDNIFTGGDYGRRAT
jgi:hypothetical protein